MSHAVSSENVVEPGGPEDVSRGKPRSEFDHLTRGRALGWVFGAWAVFLVVKTGLSWAMS